MSQAAAEILFVVLLALALWTLPWKVVALWRAAKRGEKKWFIVLLVVNTLALLEIAYLFFFSKRPGKEQEGACRGKEGGVY